MSSSFSGAKSSAVSEPFIQTSTLQTCAWIGPTLALAAICAALPAPVLAQDPREFAGLNSKDFPCASSRPPQPGSKILTAFDPLLGYLAPVNERTVSLIDSFFLFELSEPEKGRISVAAARWDAPELDRLRRLYDFVLPGLIELRDGPLTQPSGDFLNSLRAQRSELSLQDRLFILSMLGDGHSGTGTSGQATYLAHVARELGFNDVLPANGTVSYRDPLTRKLFVQKASGIFRSSQASDTADALTDRLERAESMLPSSDSFRPRTLSWVMDQALLPRDPAPIQARMSQMIHRDETLEQVCLGRSKNCTFAWNARGEDKLTSATAVGTSTTNVPGADFKLSPAEADLQRGLVRRWEERVPGLPPDAEAGSKTPEIGNISISSDGSIHLDIKPDNRAKVWAQTNFLGPDLDRQFGSRINLGTIPFEQKGKLELDLNRRIVGSGSSNVNTVDRISVVIDSRDPDKVKPYLEAEGNYYILRSAGGAENYTGIVGRLKSHLPTESRGDFYAVLRMSEFLNASNSQAVSDKISGIGTGAGWRMKLTKSIELNSEFEINNGASVNDTSTLGVSADSARNYTGNIVLRMKY